MELIRSVNGRLLRCGYTTGSCAAAAARAATELLLTGKSPRSVFLTAPDGTALTLEVQKAHYTPERAVCAVRKDAGDDPDVTDGVLIYAAAQRQDRDVTVCGGEGVGVVTKPGLDQPVGAAAINSAPRRMIRENTQAVCDACGYTGGIRITVSVPDGAELARRTFNPRMGIEGGISILGTSGIVEPMSTRALIDTVKLELRQKAAAGRTYLVLTPGNYGRAFAAEVLGIEEKYCVSCANFIGDAVDAAVESGFSQILLVGHVGKLVKLGIGVTNTHSDAGDGRMETLASCAALCGAESPLIREILHCAACDAALELLRKAELQEPVCRLLGQRIDDTLRRRVPEGVAIGYVMFTNRADLGGTLAQSENAAELTEKGRRKV